MSPNNLACKNALNFFIFKRKYTKQAEGTDTVNAT